MADKLGTPVRTIRRKNGHTLVEWKRGQTLRRNWIPDGDVQMDGEQAVVKNPAAGVPYGHNFAKLLTVNSITPDTIDAALKKHGIWTVEDLRANPSSALGALHSAYGVDLAALFQAADKYQSEEKKAAAKEQASGEDSDN